MNAKRRKKMADMLSEYDPFLRRYCLGGAIIANGRLAAAFVTAVRWLVPAPHPERVFSNVQSAYAFAEELLATAGIPAPAARVSPTSQMIEGSRSTTRGRSPAIAWCLRLAAVAPDTGAE